MGGRGSGVRNTELRNQVRKLLRQTKPVLSKAEIGRLCGVSRQRVHELAVEFAGAVVGKKGKAKA